MHLLSLAWRLFSREWRSGEMRILMIALMVAVGISTTIHLFSDRLYRAMVVQSTEVLGADLVLSSPRPVELSALDTSAVRRTDTVVFPTVVFRGEETQLVSIKAVSGAYPLYGDLKGSDQLYGKERLLDGIPGSGETWVHPRLLVALHMDVGDELKVGYKSFRITRTLTFEPGQGGNFFGIAPRVLINRDDMDATGVVQPGSRVSYQYLFAASEKRLRTLSPALKKIMLPEHRLLDVHEGQPALGNALERAQRFLSLVGLLAIVLSGVAIAMTASRYARRHYDVAALLRCFGARRTNVLSVFATLILTAGLLASTAGVVAGILIQQGLFAILAEVVPGRLPPPGWLPMLMGLMTGMIVLAGFALPPFMMLGRVSPLRVLRRDLLPAPLSAWSAYGMALSALLTLMWVMAGSLKLALIIVGGALVMMLLLGLVAWLLLRFSSAMRYHVGMSWRFGLNRLLRQMRLSIGQILAFAIVFLALTSATMVRTDLLDTWQSQLPDDAPNYFIVNIVPDKVKVIESFFTNKSINVSQLYPMIRGRMTHINGVPVTRAVSKEAQTDNTLHRELNLTWSTGLREDNKLLQGRWWKAGEHGQSLVSVESRLAKRLGINKGDRLRFSIVGQEVEAEVLSLRKVQWESFQPNFYMIFPPGVIDAFPSTWMTSFYMPDSKRGILRELARQYPATSVLELESIMQKVRQILGQVTRAIEYMLLFILVASMVVLAASMQSTMDTRLHESALLRTMGASGRQLRAGLLAELALLGLLAGLLAAVANESIIYLLYSRILNLDYSFHWQLWLVLPLLSAAIIMFTGSMVMRGTLNMPPMKVLSRSM